MKKLILTLSSLFIYSNAVYSQPDNRSNTIKISLENLPEQVLNQIKPQSKDVLKSDLDLTNLVVFARDWKNNEVRKDKIMDICSTVASKAFEKYPESKELEFSTHISYKNRVSNKNETKNVSKIIITKDNFKKVNWKNVQEAKKYLKAVNFTDL